MIVDKADHVTGVVSIALGWLTVALSPADALAWGDTLMQLAPFGLITFLVWRMRVLDAQLKDCHKLIVKNASIIDKLTKRLLDKDNEE
jgi:hypothetical protein